LGKQWSPVLLGVNDYIYGMSTRQLPERPETHVVLFDFLARSNQPGAAKFQLEEAVKTWPSDPEPYVILGNIAVKEGRIAEAVLDYEKAQKLLTTYPDRKRNAMLRLRTLSGVAQVAEVRENWKEAEAALSAYLELSPDDLPAHQRLARSLFRQAKLKEACAELKEVKELDGKNANRPGRRETGLTLLEIMGPYYKGAVPKSVIENGK
jgi:cytochrome c-type biogenesis protein CcmH/NrfG